MSLRDLLRRNSGAILKRWVDLILETYPADTAAMMRKDTNQFSNPVGATISRETAVLFGELCEGTQAERCSVSLDAILKIRSVQDFSPSQAVGFLFLLKKAIADTLKGDLHRGPVVGEWQKFQSRVDEMILRAFDIYVDCREKICEIRVNQARAERDMAFRMMERMGHSRGKGENDRSP